MSSIRQTSAALAAILAASLLAGCSEQSRRQRLLAGADRDFQAEHYDKAEVEYQAVLQIPPPSDAAIRQLGLVYFEEGRLSQAFACLSRAAQTEPANADLQVKLAAIYLSARKPKEARNAAGKALEQRPGDEMALQILADTAGQLHDAPKVQQQVQQLARQSPDRSGYHLALAVLDFQQQKMDEAASEVQRSLALNPKSSYAYSVLAAIALERHDLKPAGQAFRSAAELAPLRSSARLRNIDFLWQSGDTNQAKAILRQLNEQAPDYIPAWLSLMRMNFVPGSFDECQSVIKTILARDPVNFDALFQRGLISLAKHDASAAVAAFSQLQNRFKDIPQVPYELAAAYLLTGDKTKAAVSLNQALLIDPQFSPAVLALAELDIRDNAPGTAIGLLKPLARQQPQSGKIQLLLAEAYLVAQSPSEALAIYRKLAEAFPTDSHLQFLIGTVLTQQRDFAGARGAFEKSLQLAPGSLPAFEQLVNLDLNEKRYSAALSRINQAIDKTPKVSLLWLLKAKVYVADNDLKQAEAVLLKAIETDPDAAAPYLYLTKVYVASGNYQQALDRLTALVAKTNDPPALLQIAAIQDHFEHYDLARDAYEKALKFAPNSSVALNNLAYLYCEHYGDLKDALVMAERARQLAPYSPNAADTLATVLLKKGEYPRALALLQEAAQESLSDPEIQFHLGCAHYMMGEEAPARLAFQRAAANTADFRDKDEARRRLALLAIDPQTAGDSAMAELTRATHDRPDDPIALTRLAAIRERMGQAGEAANICETILKSNPRNVAATLELARLYSRRLNEPQKALALAKSAHALAPEDASVSQLLGELAFQSGDYPWSQDLLQEALRNSSGSSDLFYSLALACYANGDVSKAHANMKRAVEPNASFPHSADARLFLSMTAPSKDTSPDHDAAEASEILKTNANYVPALMVLATDQEHQGNHGQAETLCEKALAIYPRFTPALRLSGIAAYHSKNYARSEERLRRSAQSFGDDDEANYYLGMDYLQLNRPDDSKQALHRAMSSNPSGKFATEAKLALAKLK